MGMETQGLEVMAIQKCFWKNGVLGQIVVPLLLSPVSLSRVTPSTFPGTIDNPRYVHISRARGAV
jgi:hypothetical protein